MKKILSILLSVIIMAQTMVSVGVVVYYHLNKSYISQKLCENKNNPKMHCNGHCFLSKQLKKAEEGESKTVQVIKEKEEIISNQPSVMPQKYFPDFQISHFPVFNSSIYFSDNANALLKPPTV